MRKPSRYMKKYLNKKTKPIVLACFLIVVVLVAIFYTKVILFFIVLIVLSYIWSLIEAPKIQKHFENLLSSRQSESICEFSREFNCREIDSWVIRATYEQV